MQKVSNLSCNLLKGRDTSQEDTHHSVACVWMKGRIQNRSWISISVDGGSRIHVIRPPPLFFFISPDTDILNPDGVFVVADSGPFSNNLPHSVTDGQGRNHRVAKQGRAEKGPSSQREGSRSCWRLETFVKGLALCPEVPAEIRLNLRTTCFRCYGLSPGPVWPGRLRQLPVGVNHRLPKLQSESPPETLIRKHCPLGQRDVPWDRGMSPGPAAATAEEAGSSVSLWESFRYRTEFRAFPAAEESDAMRAGPVIRETRETQWSRGRGGAAESSQNQASAPE
ncbi:unnamed protein product [Pleuronectes platessa]|uniref:Uncharacterized protein n=1 Tax=Pleuronectes platessa TaxID=8262 RepID=A0A9N7YE82_PLEPL|nr:unnamed protein product [Pleuronectes platessa]